MSRFAATFAASLVLAASACGGTAAPSDLGASDMIGSLSLSVAVTPPVVDGLTGVSGKLEVHRLGVFADVASNTRTMVPRLELSLPSGHADLSFPDAPYGLYSRVDASLDDIELDAAWKGTPLEFHVEVEYLAIDLLGPALEYGPTQTVHMSAAIDMTKWFDPAALDTAKIENGQIFIDSRHNSDIAVSMAKAVQGSFALVPASPAQ